MERPRPGLLVFFFFFCSPSEQKRNNPLGWRKLSAKKKRGRGRSKGLSTLLLSPPPCSISGHGEEVSLPLGLVRLKTSCELARG